MGSKRGVEMRGIEALQTRCNGICLGSGESNRRDDKELLWIMVALG